MIYGGLMAMPTDASSLHGMSTVSFFKIPHACFLAALQNFVRSIYVRAAGHVDR